MFDFLNEITPTYGGCALIEVENEPKTSMNRYMVVTRIAINNGDMFLLNGRFFYDYEHIFDPKKWKIIYKKHI